MESTKGGSCLPHLWERDAGENLNRFIEQIPSVAKATFSSEYVCYGFTLHAGSITSKQHLSAQQLKHYLRDTASTPVLCQSIPLLSQAAWRFFLRQGDNHKLSK